MNLWNRVAERHITAVGTFFLTRIHLQLCLDAFCLYVCFVCFLCLSVFSLLSADRAGGIRGEALLRRLQAHATQGDEVSVRLVTDRATVHQVDYAYGAAYDTMRR